MRSALARYPIRTWRPIVEIVVSNVVVALAIAATTRISLWFYPVTAVIIANRLLALSLLCHEGLHGTLFRNRFCNDWIARFFCGFPSLISFSKYRRLHYMHHLAVGTTRWDPDVHIYNFFPLSPWRYFAHQLGLLLQLKTVYRFMQYYTEIPEFFRGQRNMKGNLLVFSKDSDFISFVLSSAAGLFTVVYWGLWHEYLLFYLIPLLVLVQPYVLLMGGLQHGPVQPGQTPELVSRSIRGPKWLMEILLPCDINFHAEHHRNPAVPHYWLKDYARELERENVRVWKQSYWQALRSLFSTHHIVPVIYEAPVARLQKPIRDRLDLLTHDAEL